MATATSNTATKQPSALKPANPKSQMGRIRLLLDNSPNQVFTAQEIEVGAPAEKKSVRTMLHHLTVGGKIWRPVPGKYQSLLGLTPEKREQVIAEAIRTAKVRGAAMTGREPGAPPPTAPTTAPTTPAAAFTDATTPQPDGEVIGDDRNGDDRGVVVETATPTAVDTATAPGPDPAHTDEAPVVEAPATLADVVLLALKLTDSATPADLVKFLKTQPEAERLPSITQSFLTEMRGSLRVM